jgi:FkbM family methyltransferase
MGNDLGNSRARISLPYVLRSPQLLLAQFRYRSAMGNRIEIAAAHLTRMVVTYWPPKRRGLRLADFSERMFGHSPKSLNGVHQTGARILCDLQDSVQRSLFYSGTYEPVLTALIEAELRPGDIFLDIGANVGHYSLLAASKLGEGAQIHAIEASGQTAMLLQDTVNRNRLGGSIIVHQVAASDRKGQMVLSTPADSTSFMGMRHLTPRGGVGELVEVVRMDEYLNVTPSVVKIDVEGADLRALVGMERLLRNSPPRCLFVEAVDNQLARFGDSTEVMVDYMSSMGYSSEKLVEQYYADTVVFRHKY